MNYDENVLKEAFMLYHSLLEDGSLEKKKKPEIYRFFFSSQVKDVLQNIIQPIAKVKFFNVDDTIYLVPETDNEVFSYSNEELRNIMKLNSNKELYMAQFIWLCVLSEFYGDQFQYTNEIRTYVKVEEILKKVDDYISEFKKLNEDERYELSVEYDMDLEGLIEVWENLGSITEDVKDIRRATKRNYGFVLKVLDFWEKEKLIIVRNNEEIVLTEKMKNIAGQYYHHEERINKIKELLNQTIEK